VNGEAKCLFGVKSGCPDQPQPLLFCCSEYLPYFLAVFSSGVVCGHLCDGGSK
jgi:hypothetical protein